MTLGLATWPDRNGGPHIAAGRKREPSAWDVANSERQADYQSADRPQAGEGRRNVCPTEYEAALRIC